MMALSKKQVATAKEVQRKASRYLLEELGNRLWAGDPTYDERHEQWTVPIHSRSLPADVGLGQITLDAYGNILRAPSHRDVQRAVQRHQAAAPAPVPLPLLAFTQRRGDGEIEQEPLALPDLPEDLQAIGQELLADPDLKRAYRYLKLALADPQMRPTVLAALEAFARAACPTAKEPE